MQFVIGEQSAGAEEQHEENLKFFFIKQIHK
jgi:hypothetical protein